MSKYIINDFIYYGRICGGGDLIGEDDTMKAPSKKQIELIGGVTALLALLAYTMVHTGALLARYIHPSQFGYVAAFGIELAVVGLSLRIGDLKRSKQDARFFVSVLIAVVIVSALANIAEGFAAINNDTLLTVETIQRLDPVQAVIGLAATGLISLIVLAMSEIIGTDITQAVKQSAKDDKQVATLKQELSRVRRELSKAEQDRVKLQKQLDNGVVIIDSLPPKFAAVVTAVANGDKLNGALVSEHGISQSTLDRIATLTK